MFLWLLKTLQQRYFLFLFQFFDVRQIRILWTLLNWQNEQFNITSSALLFSVSHKTNLARTDGITVIAIPRDFKHMVYFLVKFFRRSVISFFR